MLEVVAWIYFVNAIFLIIHEIESAYWKEWELFKLGGGLTGFLCIHIPMLGLILYGLIEVFNPSLTGMILSIILCVGGFFAFFIHLYFIRKGKPEFTLPISKIILGIILVLSIVQIVLTIWSIFYYHPLYQIT